MRFPRLGELLKRVPRNPHDIFNAMWGVAGGALVGWIFLGWLGGIWSIVNDIGSVGLRIAIGIAMGVAVSWFVSQWGTTNVRVAIGAGFIIGAIAGGAAGFVVVAVGLGSIAGALICREIHRTY